ncbi:glycosyl transferase family 2 [Lelliottia sp. WB101]|uniref:glycosyltransferase family 2 protein n=1 Tax=Lelliottia sp. WB101 TaxID=2153385 RepID=UPI000D1FEAFA|nr:glycosyltransferase family 2 protein [Lelliottia sp. WB101]AVY98481.1 glycosyl transferase family 2 [Lelliottia sp. WB101]
MDSVKHESLVSIITPTFNSLGFIQETYRSISEQNYKNWEWIVTDDCSNDGSFDFLKQLSMKDERVRLFKLNKNSGAAVARNNSIDHSNGEYIAFLDADDYWEKDKLSLQIKYMEERSLEFCFTSYACETFSERKLCKIVDATHSGEVFTYKDMLMKKATLGCSTVILKKCLVKQHRMPLIRTGQDYAFWLQLLKETNAVLFNHCLTHYRIVPGSLSRNKFKKAKRQWYIYREIEKINLLPAAYYFLFYAYRAIFRK